MRIAHDSGLTGDLRLWTAAAAPLVPAAQIGTAGYFDEPKLSSRVLSWLDEPRVDLAHRSVQQDLAEILRHSTVPGTSQNVLRMLSWHDGPPLSDRALLNALIDLTKSSAPQARGLKNLAEQVLHKFDAQDPLVCLDAVLREVRTLRVDYLALENRIRTSPSSQEFQSAFVERLASFKEHEHAGLFSIGRGFSESAHLTAETYRELIDGPAVRGPTAGRHWALIALSNARPIPEEARGHFHRLPELALRETNALATTVMDCAIAELARRDPAFAAEAVGKASLALGGAPGHERLRAIMLLGRLVRAQPEARAALEVVLRPGGTYSTLERYFAAVGLGRDELGPVPPELLGALAAGLPEISRGPIGDFDFPPHGDGMTHWRSTEDEFRAQATQGALAILSRHGSRLGRPDLEREILHRMIDALFDGPDAASVREALGARLRP